MKIAFLILAIWLMASSALAQKQVPVLIDEFGTTNCDDHRGRVDLFLTELNNDPDARGTIIVYDGDLELPRYDKQGKKISVKYVRTKVGLAQVILEYYKNHLIFRRFSLDRIDLVYGGFRPTLTTALWKVPSGAVPPKPTPTLTVMKQRKKKPETEGFCSQP